MTNLIRFPASRRIPATTIPREEFERLAELAVDVVDRIVALLDEADGDPNAENDGIDAPTFGAVYRAGNGRTSQLIWAAGGDLDLER